VLWLLSDVEFTFTFDESLGTWVSLGVEGVPGVMPCVVLVEVTGVGVASGMTTGGGVGVVLAFVSELLRLQPTKARGKLTDRRAMRNLFLVGFIDVLSLVRLDTVELIYFPTLSTVRCKGMPCYGAFTPLSVAHYRD
jgi:hypothetical protein